VTDNYKQLTGIVTSVHKTGFNVCMHGETVFCILGSALKNKAGAVPVINDTVTMENRGGTYIITELAERRNYIGRYDFYKEREQVFAANIDTAFVITSANREFSENRVARFLALLNGKGVKPVIVLTKADLTEDLVGYEQRLSAAFPDITYVSVNSNDAKAVRGLLSYIERDGTALLLGSSGVGKSTIVNTLLGTIVAKTGDIQAVNRGNKGKHTTSYRAMYTMLDGRKIIDSPGIRIVGLREDSVAEENPYARKRVRR
jgi:ribosome biogenesis GTPase